MDNYITTVGMYWKLFAGYATTSLRKGNTLYHSVSTTYPLFLKNYQIRVGYSRKSKTSSHDLSNKYNNYLIKNVLIILHASDTLVCMLGHVHKQIFSAQRTLLLSA